MICQQFPRAAHALQCQNIYHFPQSVNIYSFTNLVLEAKYLLGDDYEGEWSEVSMQYLLDEDTNYLSLCKL